MGKFGNRPREGHYNSFRQKGLQNRRVNRKGGVFRLGPPRRAKMSARRLSTPAILAGRRKRFLTPFLP
jgi:hypothetical protein